jgi:hypothetical protein
MLHLFVPKKEDVAENWRQLHKENICNLHLSPKTVRVIMNDDDVGRTLSMRRGNEKCIQHFGQKTSRVETAWEI